MLIAAIAAFEAMQGPTCQPATVPLCLLSRHCQAQNTTDYHIYMHQSL